MNKKYIYKSVINHGSFKESVSYEEKPITMTRAIMLLSLRVMGKDLKSIIMIIMYPLNMAKAISF